jgi:phospholipase/carboxylesterase
VLTHELREPTNPSADAPLIVLMHGRGTNRFDLMALADHMPAQARVVFPEAPFDAARWGYGAGTAWYRFLGRNRPDADSFSRSLDELAELIRHFSAQRVVVGGFSQGGTVSIAYALTHPGTVTGVLNFSGFLADHPRVTAAPENVEAVKFFWGHGRQDPSIPFALAVEGRAELARAGADLTSRDYDIGHWIDSRELADAVQWLETTVL